MATYFIILFIMIVAAILAFILPFIAAFFISIKNSAKKSRKLIGENKADYFRDIPCKWNIDLCYYIALFYDRNVVELQLDFISAKALKFYVDKKIDIKKDEKGKYYLDLTSIPKFDNEVDKYIYNILLAASSSNNLLTQHELSLYLYRNYASVMHSFDMIQEILKEKFEESKLDPEEEYKHICGLKKFINDFSILPELDHEHVHLRKEYLMFGILFDLTRKIEADFQHIYPFTYNNPLLDYEHAREVYGNNIYEDQLLMKYPWLRPKEHDAIDKTSSDYDDMG